MIAIQENEFTVFVFDGSFEGFLTTVFSIYEKKYQNIPLMIVSCQDYTPNLWQAPIEITTDTQKSARVFEKINALFKKDTRQILWAFLSELPEIYGHLFYLIKFAIENPDKKALNHLTHPSILAVNQAVKMVGRERHRMQAFVRFELVKTGVYFAKIAPDFNVLPLVATFFSRRFSAQSFVIFDLKRGFGIFYYHEKKTLEEVLEISEDFLKNPNAYYDEKEVVFQTLWQAYFHHVTIQERKNMTLHIKQMPKRYWKYLTEKQGIY